MEGSKKALTFDSPNVETGKEKAGTADMTQAYSKGVENTMLNGGVNSSMQGTVGKAVLSLEKEKGAKGSGRGFKRMKRT